MAKGTIFLVGFLLLHCWVILAKDEYMKYKDPKQPLNTRIKDLIDRMTMEEKIGQMVQIERVNATARVMQKYFIGKCFLKLSFNLKNGFLARFELQH
jgi:beta-glucosidase